MLGEFNAESEITTLTMDSIIEGIIPKEDYIELHVRPLQRECLYI